MDIINLQNYRTCEINLRKCPLCFHAILTGPLRWCWIFFLIKHGKISCKDDDHLTWGIPIAQRLHVAGVQQHKALLVGCMCNQKSITSSVTWSCNFFTDASLELPKKKKKKEEMTAQISLINYNPPISFCKSLRCA
jgi:hypothetical protein